MQIWRICVSTLFVAANLCPNIALAAKHANKQVHTDERSKTISHSRPKLESDAVLVIAQKTGEALFSKNADEKKAIASITKLMTAMVILDSKQPLNRSVTISTEDIDRQRGSSSRLRIGAALPRGMMLQLALMSSENRAASALARNYHGGVKAFVAAMNRKAISLGMKNTTFYDPTGLDARNVSTAADLAIMVHKAYGYNLIRSMSTMSSHQIRDRNRKIAFRNTNRLVRSKGWNIGLSKTGYISESGKCLVMQATIRKTPTIIVLLDSWGRYSRIADAVRVKRWLERSTSRKLHASL